MAGSGVGGPPDEDDGRPDPGLAAALGAWQADPSTVAEGRVSAALLASRLLVPIVPLPDSEHPETARPTLIGADGRQAMPVFTSLDAVARWRADARPVRVPATKVLVAAVESEQALVLDVAGPVPFVVEGSVLRSLASGYVPVAGAEQIGTHTVEGGLSVVGEPYVPTAELGAAVAASLAQEPLVAEAYILAPEPGPDTSDVAVGLVLRDDVSPRELVALVRRLADVLGPSPAVTTGLDIAVLTGEQRAAALALGPPAYLAHQRA